MATPRFTRGDTLPTLVFQFAREDGTVVDLTGADKVYCRLAPRGGGSPVLVKEATVNTATDKATVTLAEGDLEIPAGAYLFTAELDQAGSGTSIQNTYQVEIMIDDVLAANLLVNSGFESGATASWTNAPAAGGTIAEETTVVRVGTKSLKFNIPAQAAANPSTSRQTVALFPHLPVVGDKVTLSAYVLATSLEATWGRYRLRLEGSTDGGGTWTDVGTPAWLTTTGVWARRTLTGTVAANTTHLRVTLETEGGAVVYWDGVQLEPGWRATPYRDVA